MEMRLHAAERPREIGRLKRKNMGEGMEVDVGERSKRGLRVRSLVCPLRGNSCS